MNLKSIFSKLPIQLQEVLLRYVGRKNKKIRYGGNFKSYLEDAKSRIYAEPHELILFQKTMLSDLLKEVNKFSTYYSELITKNGGLKSDPNVTLNKLPFLEKSVIREDIESLLNNNPKRGKNISSKTSGTTGTPTISYYDHDSVQLSFAFWKRFHYWIGIKEIYPRSIRFSGNIIKSVNNNKPPFWIENKIENQLLMSTYHLSPENLITYIKKLNSYKPKLLDGYPSAIFILADFIIKNDIKLTFVPEAICTTAETLYDHYREKIETAFSCKVYNQYASSEGGSFITECTYGKYHLNIDTGVFRFFNVRGKEVWKDEMGELVVTSFRSWKTPLINYKSGDWVKLGSDIRDLQKCNCGSYMPVIEKILGRQDDILVNADGAMIGMASYRILKHTTNIKECQIIQDKKNNILFNVVKAKGYDVRDEKRLIKIAKEVLGSNTVVAVEYVNTISKSANGKFKSVVKK